MKNNFEWTCQHTWNRSAYNTLWCLIGCSIGDFGTIVLFQFCQRKALHFLSIILSLKTKSAFSHFTP